MDFIDVILLLMLLGLITYKLVFDQFDPSVTPQTLLLNGSVQIVIPDSDPLAFQRNFIKLPKDLFGPEDLIVLDNGDLYTGLQHGQIVFIPQSDGSRTQTLAKGKGQILGLIKLKKSQKILFIDTKVGICQLDLKTGVIQPLLTELNGTQASQQLIDYLVQASNGNVYFSLSSNRYNMASHMNQFIAIVPTGAIYSFNPDTRIVTLIKDKLYFPNGLALSADESILFVAQSNKLRILKIHLTGDDQGKSSVLKENLIGVPDNIKTNHKGQILISLAAYRNWKLDFLFKFTFVRKILLKLHQADILKNKAQWDYVGGIKINQNTGQTIQQYIGTAAHLHFSTTLYERNNKIYITGLKTNTIAVIDEKDFQRSTANSQGETQRIQL